MKPSISISLGLGVLLAIGWVWHVGVADPPNGVVPAAFRGDPPSTTDGPSVASPGTAAESVLLLRNGEIVQGRIRRLGDRYEVLISGGEIYIKAADVQCHCQNVHEAYLHKRSLLRQDNVLDRLDLAQWCIKTGLLGPAANELEEAAALEPNHPLLPVLERRLKMALVPPPKAKQADRPTPLGPTPQELDRLVRGMPPKTVETFAQVIQPMLLNNCSAAACHGPSSTNRFRLWRGPGQSPPSRLVTQRNLHAALQWLDPEHPTASPLLSYSTQPHGNGQVRIPADSQGASLQQLRDWCLRVAQAGNPVVPASYNEPVGSSAETSGPTSRGSTFFGTPAEEAPQPKQPRGRSAHQASNAYPAEQAGSTDHGLRKSRKRSTRQPEPAAPDSTGDPFDPEPFNRRFAPARHLQKAPDDSGAAASAVGREASAPAQPGQAQSKGSAP